MIRQDLESDRACQPARLHGVDFLLTSATHQCESPRARQAQIVTKESKPDVLPEELDNGCRPCLCQCVRTLKPGEWQSLTSTCD